MPSAIERLRNAIHDCLFEDALGLTPTELNDKLSIVYGIDIGRVLAETTLRDVGIDSLGTLLQQHMNMVGPITTATVKKNGSEMHVYRAVPTEATRRDFEDRLIAQEMRAKRPPGCKVTKATIVPVTMAMPGTSSSRGNRGRGGRYAGMPWRTLDQNMDQKMPDYSKRRTSGAPTVRRSAPLQHHYHAPPTRGTFHSYGRHAPPSPPDDEWVRNIVCEMPPLKTVSQQPPAPSTMETPAPSTTETTASAGTQRGILNSKAKMRHLIQELLREVRPRALLLKALCIRLEEKEPSAAEFFVRDQQKVLEFVREKFSETVDIREVDDEFYLGWVGADDEAQQHAT